MKNGIEMIEIQLQQVDLLYCEESYDSWSLLHIFYRL